MGINYHMHTIIIYSKLLYSAQITFHFEKDLFRDSKLVNTNSIIIYFPFNIEYHRFVYRIFSSIWQTGSFGVNSCLATSRKKLVNLWISIRERSSDPPSVDQICWHQNRNSLNEHRSMGRIPNSEQSVRMSRDNARYKCVWPVFVAVGHRLHGEDEFARVVKLPRFKGWGSICCG